MVYSLLNITEPYTSREARLHVRHIRDLLKSVDNRDAYEGLNCASLSFLNTVTSGNIAGEKIVNYLSIIDTLFVRHPSKIHNLYYLPW